ncbi:hypothetical protein BG011_002045 [Mortierella polycephala]|uniref:Uncharacterized protein n=1 Tax=Mortierella polycephala TaxID=41804 RepID=A0A9P6Q5Y0_9FUNG|nr:hypothetical protein BG011_002045 [Mortierella polycephala]
MISPTTPDSWRSPSGPRGYASPGAQYSPSTNYNPPHHQYSSPSSVVNDDHRHHGRSRNYPYESDSDDYYNRQGGRTAAGYGSGQGRSQGQGQDQGHGRYMDDRSAHSLSYTNSVASNTSSVAAARRARNERNERNQRQKAAQLDEWLTSPTGTELDTEILPWSDDEAIVAKAIRSPPTGYSNEKSLPPIPYRGPAQPLQQPATINTINMPPERRMDSDMIKVEVGEATTVIPTTNEGSGFTFVKNVSTPSSPPMLNRHNVAPQGFANDTQSMTGAANSFRAAVSTTNSTDRQERQPVPPRPSDRRSSSNWVGQRISLDDMISVSSPQAADSWRASPPPFRAQDESSAFTSLKSKRRSSLPEKFVPDWNEHAENWSNGINQRRPSWMASSAGIFNDQDGDKEKDKDDFAIQKQKWADHGAQSKQGVHHQVTIKNQSTFTSIPARGDNGHENDSTALDDHNRESTRFSWHSAEDADMTRRSWESGAPSAIGKQGSRKMGGTGGPRYSTTGEEELTDYEDDYKDKSTGVLGAAGHNLFNLRDTKNADVRRPSIPQGSDFPAPQLDRGGHNDSDADSMDSPPVKVQYARRPAHSDDDDDDDDDDMRISSKHPVSIISTFNLPPAASPTSPQAPPPLPMSYQSMVPPPVPESQPLSPRQLPPSMTSVTTVSIEATTAVLSSSRVSVDSFKNVPGNSGAGSREMIHSESDINTDIETDTESVNYKSEKHPKAAVSDSNMANNHPTSASSSAPSSYPLSITTSQLSRNESSTSSISVLSARSTKSFMSTSSAHSVSSILSASPPPQRAPPPIPSSDGGSGNATTGSGLFSGAKRSGSGGSARGVRSGLSKQILPAVVPLPQGPPPASSMNANIGSGSKPSYGILPPPIPSSFNEPSMSAVSGAVAATAASSAIQIQMLADEDQSRSQMGAVSIESDERLLTRLNNQVAQLERELEFAQQDLDVSQDDVHELQNKVRDLETELDEVKQSSDTRESERRMGQDQEHEAAKEAWALERTRLLEDMDRLREDHAEELKVHIKDEQVKHEQEMERLSVEHTASLETFAQKSAQEQDLMRTEHSRALEDQKARLEIEQQDALGAVQTQLEAMEARHADSLATQHSEHEARFMESQKEWESKMESVREEGSKGLQALGESHRQQVDAFEQQLADLEKAQVNLNAERDQAIRDLEHHKKETEIALDRLEVVLAEDKQTHARLVQDLEHKAKRLEARVAELETEHEEVMQDNVQIVEEMQRREDMWAQERTLLQSSEGNHDGDEARLQEMHQQLVGMTESKRQADAQFQGIVKGLLREATANKKELEERQSLLEQERQGKDEVQHQLFTLQQEMQSLQQERQSLQQEKQSLFEQKHTLEQEKDEANQKWTVLEQSQREVEGQLEELKRSGDEAMFSIQKELEERLRQQEQALGTERAKSKELEDMLAENLSRSDKDMQQEQFVWKTRLDQVEAALKTKEAQVRKLEQEADATIKIQTDLVQSMERDAANSNKKLEASLLAKMTEMEQAFEAEKKRIQQELQQELLERFEQDSIEKETRLQQQLESIHQQELMMSRQEVSVKFEQQLSSMKQQHELSFEQSKEKLEKLQQQNEQERSEKEVALKDRTFLERKMAGHDRRQKELESALESLQQQLDQSRTKSEQDLQDLERSKMSLERKFGMAKEDIEELNKLRNELENDRDELQEELQWLKKAGPNKGGAGAGANAAAWEAEKRGLQEQLRKLEDEVQIMLEKNMNLTIELSMR